MIPRPRGNPITSRPAHPIPAAACAALLLFASAAHAARCGTARWFELAAGEGPAAAKSAAAARNQGRTLVSDNFLIHYSMRGLHRVRTIPADTAVVRAADSLYAILFNLGEGARDSAVYARMDSAKLPHPAYILKTRDYLEASWAHYIGALGMKAPASGVLSVHYDVPATLPKRFPVDVVDIGTADPDYAGETYGITYPTSQLSISFENDFLCCNTSLDEKGRIHGKEIASRLNGQVVRNYAQEWELGIKVTAFHEFYHAVQFTYVPRVVNYHAWYEISATGMEERLAGDVDDYLQYLPCVLGNHDRVALNSGMPGPCTHYPMYGHAIFHQYLGKALDSAFDVKIWDQLGRNNDAFKDGLETGAAKYGKAFADLYSEYAAEVFFGGKRFAAPAPSAWTTNGLFSDDFAKWPNTAYDSVDMEGDPFRVVSLPALTFAILKIKWGPKAVPRVLQAKVASGFTRIHADKDTAIVERLAETQLTLGAPRDGFDSYFLVLPNPSFTDKGTVEIKDPGAEFYAFPNPVQASTGGMSFSQAKGMAFPAQVRIYSEAGRLVRLLDFATASQSLAWDLKDAAGAAVKPGIYYYRLGAEPLKTLVLLR